MSHRARLPLAIPGLLIVAALALVAAPARAQGKEGKPTAADTSAITAAQIDEGRALFHGRAGCHACHGEHLEGTAIAPTLRAHKWRDATDGAFPQIYRVITTGVEGTAMVSHPGGIDDAQALALASYIWAVNNHGAKP